MVFAESKKLCEDSVELTQIVLSLRPFKPESRGANLLAANALAANKLANSLSVAGYSLLAGSTR